MRAGQRFFEGMPRNTGFDAINHQQLSVREIGIVRRQLQHSAFRGCWWRLRESGSPSALPPLLFPRRHQVGKLLKQIHTILWPRAGFGVILHREDRLAMQGNAAI